MGKGGEYAEPYSVKYGKNVLIDSVEKLNKISDSNIKP